MISIAIVLTLVAVTIAVFATELLPIEVFSVVVMVTLVATGILTSDQAFAGLGSSAVIMIGGVMILTGGLLHNGVMERLVLRMPSAARAERRGSALLLLAVNGVSSFINNVAATALFIPVAEGLASTHRTNRSRYLMAVAFASMTGGVCTLVGTSTNIAVARAMPQYGLEPLGMFELTPLGILIAGVGLIFLVGLAPVLYRPRPQPGEGDAFGLKEFLYEILVRDDGVLAGKTLAEADIGGGAGVTVLAILREDHRIDSPDNEFVIRAHDRLLAKSTAENVTLLRGRKGLDIKSMPAEHERELAGAGTAFVEATVSYNSPLIGKSLMENDFRRRYGLSVLAIHRREELLADKLGKIPLKAADVLLLYGREDKIQAVLEAPSTMLVGSVVVSRYHANKAILAGIVFIAAVVVSVVGWLDAPAAFLGGGALVLLLGCLPPSEIRSHLNIRFLVMIAGMVSLGTAMETTGAAALMADTVQRVAGASSPVLVMAAYFAMTVVLTQPLNNAAAALLMLPVSVHGAANLGVDPRPFVVTVTVAASCSFATPFEPANLLVYSKGHYHFLDFVRVGGLLTIVVFGLCLALIPLMWPFHP